MLPGTAPSDPSKQKEKEKDGWRKILIALLFLLLSFSCIFCSSQSALWLINRDRVYASMRSNLNADYGFDPALMLAPLSEEIITEAEQDEAVLLARHTPVAVGLGIVILPNPVPTPAPTEITLLPTVIPTPTPAAPSNPNPAPATPAAPTATNEAPPTAVPPSTSTSAPPPTSPPTVPPTSQPTAPATTQPTVPPTVPATVPPTIPPTVAPTVPPTVPPTAVPPTAVPPTATSTSLPTATFTPVHTATPTNTPTATSTSTATSTPTITATPTATDTPTITPTPPPPDTPTPVPTDTPVPPSVQFDLNDYPAGEGDGSVDILVTLSGTSATTITVEYVTSNLTAEESSDYTAANGALTFPPGTTSQTFSVTINDDNLDEPDETVRLTLRNPNGATLGTPSTATLTIEDDDTPTGTCAGVYPPGEPNIGSPNADPAPGNFAAIACGAGMIIDLGSSPVIVDGDAGTYDLVYYELQGDVPRVPPYYIFMDVVRVEVSQTGTDPWFKVFEWGDGTDDTNTNIGGTYPDTGPASDNTVINGTDLFGPGDPLNTGIQIDVDTVPGGGPPPGSYQYIRILSPIGGGGGNDRLEVDAIEVLP